MITKLAAGALILGFAVASLLTGCGLFTKAPDTVTFERGQFFVATFNVGQAYATMRTKIEIRCESGRLDKEFCDYAKGVDREMERSVKKPLLDSLSKPGPAVVDWNAVIIGVGIIADLAGKAF